MPVIMRQVQRRKLLARTRDKAVQTATSTIHTLLDRRYKALQRELRRARFNRNRLGKRLARDGTLFKAGGEDEQDWLDWIEQFDTQLRDALAPMASDMYSAEAQYFATRGLRAAPVEPEKIINAYLKRNGKQFKNVAQTTQSDVLDEITRWYNTDAGLPELISNLSKYFDASRAEMIARTESSYISSQVSYGMMQQFGIKKWNWDLGDPMGDYPCEICLGQNADNPHDLEDPMPPDTSHPNCRCGVSYANDDGSELIYGQEQPAQPVDVYGPDEPTDPEQFAQPAMTGTANIVPPKRDVPEPVQDAGPLQLEEPRQVGGQGAGALGLETDIDDNAGPKQSL